MANGRPPRVLDILRLLTGGELESVRRLMPISISLCDRYNSVAIMVGAYESAYEGEAPDV